MKNSAKIALIIRIKDEMYSSFEHVVDRTTFENILSSNAGISTLSSLIDNITTEIDVTINQPKL